MLTLISPSKTLDFSRDFSQHCGDAPAKVVAIYAKRARGEMANWIIQRRVDTVAGLRKFAADDWKFVAAASDAGRLSFVKNIK